MTSKILTAGVSANMIYEAAINLLSTDYEDEARFQNDGVQFALSAQFRDGSGDLEVMVFEDRGKELFGICAFWREDGDSLQTFRFKRWDDDDDKLAPNSLAALEALQIKIGCGVGEPGEILLDAA